MDKVLIGKITSPVGLKGEVRVWNYSDRDQVYEETEDFIVEDRTMKLEKMRPHKNMLILKFHGIDNREDAEAIRNSRIFVDRQDLPELEEGEFYIRDLIGMTVAEGPAGELMKIGRVKDVISNTSQDILKVETSEKKEILIPCVEPIINEIDEDMNMITVDLPEGLLDL